MMQQVARARLADFRAELGSGNFFALAKMITGQARRAMTETNPVVTRNTSTEHLRSADFQLNALSYREQDLLVGLARRLKRRIDEGMDSFLAFNDCQDHAVALANAHIESFLLEAFVETEKIAPSQLRPTLARLRNLFALSCIEEEIGWFLENGYVQTGKARAIRDQVNLLCQEVRQEALALVDAYAIPDQCLSAPIAFSDKKSPADARPQFARGVADL
jgi:acyl-CoA oxidase